MPVESSYSVVKAALVTRLKARPALAAVNVLGHVPVNKEDLRTGTGAQEVVYLAGATGTFSDVVFCAGNLRFDETLVVDVVVEVVGQESDDSQAVVDARCNSLFYELLADVAAQQTWDFAALGLGVFDYVYFTPATQTWAQGRVEGTVSAYAAAVTVGLQVNARRSFG